MIKYMVIIGYLMMIDLIMLVLNVKMFYVVYM